MHSDGREREGREGYSPSSSLHATLALTSSLSPLAEAEAEAEAAWLQPRIMNALARLLLRAVARGDKFEGFQAKLVPPDYFDERQSQQSVRRGQESGLLPSSSCILNRMYSCDATLGGP